MTKNKLLVHVGHPKTGTSALQAFFAENRGLLLERGIDYPLPGRSEGGVGGKISSGNGYVLEGQLDALNPTVSNSVLYSSEGLYQKLLKDVELRNALLAKAQEQGLEVEVIVYTRDFFEFTFSQWGQNIKRQGMHFSYEEFAFESETNFAIQFYWLKDWIETAKNEGFRLKIFNYERQKDSLIPHFLGNVLGLEGAQAIAADYSGKRVNRSLNSTEHEIQRLFNLYYPKKSAAFVSDRFVEELPDIKSDIPAFSEETYSAIVRRHGDFIKDLNEELEASQQILFRPFKEISCEFSSSDLDELIVTRSQLDVLVKSVSQRLSQRPELSSRQLLVLLAKTNLSPKLYQFLKRLRNK